MAYNFQILLITILALLIVGCSNTTIIQDKCSFQSGINMNCDSFNVDSQALTLTNEFDKGIIINSITLLENNTEACKNYMEVRLGNQISKNIGLECNQSLFSLEKTMNFEIQMKYYFNDSDATFSQIAYGEILKRN